MRYFRSLRTRRWATALALMTLVLQSFVVTQHAAAMAATKAETALVLADLAVLGVGLEDLPCHSDLQEAARGQTMPSAKKACPDCTSHAGSVWALLAPQQPTMPIVLETVAAVVAPPATVVPNVRVCRPETRGPPAAA